MGSHQNKAFGIANPKFQRLSALEDILEDIIDHLPVNFFLIDKDANYILQSSNLAKIVSGIKKADVIDMTSWRDCQQVIRQNKKKIIEDKYKNKYFLSIKSPLVIEGETLGVIGFSVDISNQKRIVQLEKQNEINRQLIQRLKAISSCLSYEIRSPMSGIRLGLENTRRLLDRLARLVTSTDHCPHCCHNNDVTIKEVSDCQHLLAKMMQRIDTSVTLMDMQLKNMMTVRIEQRFFQPHKIKHSIEQAVKTFPLEHEELRNKIHITISHDFSIYGDGVLTKHMLWNLLNNALSSIRKSDRGEIFITTEEMIDYYLLRFKDTGQGNTSDGNLETLEQFHANHTSDCSLGLHFCQSVMDAYRGRIECHAKAGQYTEILLYFPKEFDS